MARPGDVPIDRYVVLEHLSEGGMGAIYVGKKLGAGGFEMEVVLKQLLPEFTQQEEFIDLFLREAKLSATLDHANIIHTIDLVTAGGEYFIVMEYLPGGDLRTLLRKAKRRGKRFSVKAAIYITREVLSALSYAHAKRDLDGHPLRLIHRDVSPSNVLLSYAGEIKLTDFGIAKAATHTSLFYKVKGKIGYMSPEQAKSEALDHRSDLYSIAVCMYEALTGERLFVHAGLTTSAEEIYAQPVPQVSRKVPGVPAELDQIVSKALALDANARFQTAGEFQEALMRLAHRHGLLMSAPELAAELRESCGPIEQWRDDDEDDDFGYADHKRAGTEVYDASDDEDDDHDNDADDAISEPISIAARSSQSVMRARTELGKLAGMELTSIINMIDLEAQGSQPLVDLDAPPNTPVTPVSIAPTVPRAHAKPPVPVPRSPAQIAQVPITRPGPAPAPPRPPATASASAAISAPATAPMRFPRAGSETERAHPARRRRTRPDALVEGRRAPARNMTRWIVIATILLLAGAAALVVALSGPSVTGS